MAESPLKFQQYTSVDTIEKGTTQGLYELASCPWACLVGTGIISEDIHRNETGEIERAKHGMCKSLLGTNCSNNAIRLSNETSRKQGFYKDMQEMPAPNGQPRALPSRVRRGDEGSKHGPILVRPWLLRDSLKTLSMTCIGERTDPQGCYYDLGSRRACALRR